MKKFTKLMCLALTVLMAVASVGCGGSANYAENNTTYKIGFTAPTTGSGSDYGTAVVNSVQLAMKEINANGGFEGVKFESLPYDDANDSSKVATNYTAMMEKGMNFSLGAVSTKPGLEFKEFAHDDNVFFLTPSASGDDITMYDTGFQMCYADSDLGLASANYFNANYNGKKIGVFYQSDNDYSTGIYKKFMDNIDKTKFSDVTVSSFITTTKDYTQNATSLSNCDVLFMPIYYAEAQLFMDQAKKNVANSKVSVYFGCDGFDGLTVPEGVTQEVSLLTHFASDATSGPAKEYIDKYKENFPKGPLNQFGASAYDCVYAIFEALKEARKTNKEFNQQTSASDFADILKAVFTSDSFIFHGITGKCNGNEKSTIKWSKNGKVVKEAVKFVIQQEVK